MPVEFHEGSPAEKKDLGTVNFAHAAMKQRFYTVTHMILLHHNTLLNPCNPVLPKP